MTKLAIIGAGVMGEAIATGLLESGWTPKDIVLADLREDRLEQLHTSLGAGTTTSPRDAAQSADGTLIAVKPQEAAVALEALAGAVGRSGLVSIIAGMRAASIEHLLGGSPSVVRAMPNAPARVGKCVTALAPGSNASVATKELAQTVFAAVGPVFWVDENDLDAVTALSGSGPAYVFLLAEAMVEAGVGLGLAREIAAALVYETIEGAGRMLTQTGTEPATLRAQVTSKGGTTEAAVGVLEDADLRKIVTEAIAAAHRRSRELGR